MLGSLYEHRCRPSTRGTPCGPRGPAPTRRDRWHDTLLPAARAADELIDAVAAIEALKSTLDAFELQVVAELEATGAVKPFGWASTKDFCTAVIGGHRGTGPAMVRLAEDVATSRFAPVAAALRDGWLSTTKAIVITRAVNDLPSTADHERGVAALLDEAKRLDATELRRVGRHLLTVLDPSGTDRRDEAALDREARTAHDRRYPVDHRGRLRRRLAEGALLRGGRGHRQEHRDEPCFPTARPRVRSGRLLDPRLQSRWTRSA